MSLLRNEALEQLSAVAMQFSDRLDDAVSMAQYGSDGSGTPAGIKRLDTPQERATWQRFLERNARREQDGTQPGDVTTAALQHPAVQEGFNGDVPASPVQ